MKITYKGPYPVFIIKRQERIVIRNNNPIDVSEEMGMELIKRGFEEVKDGK